MLSLPPLLHLILKYKFCLGKVEALSVTNQNKEKAEGGKKKQGKERHIRIKYHGMLNRLQATVLASAVRQLSELIA